MHVHFPFTLKRWSCRKVNFSDFHLDVYERGMHRRVSFIIKNKRLGAFLSLACLLSIVINVRSIDAAENYWIAKKPMPRPCWGGAVALNGKIYFFVWNITYEYDPAAGNWTTKAPMLTPRKGFAVAAYKNKIYVIGGEPIGAYGRFYCGVNEVYDPTTGNWEVRAEMPTKRGSMCAAVVGGKIYLIAGLENPVDEAPNISVLNEVYDPEVDAWTTAKSIPVGVCRYACAVLDDKIYVMAGWDRPDLLQIYDTKTDTWNTGPSPPVPLVDAAAAATTGTWAPKRIYLIGGRHKNYTVSNSVQVYNPEDGSWASGKPMPTARYAATAVVLNDTIYVMGGMEMMFNLNPPYGLTAANEQYIPIGYDPHGLRPAQGTPNYAIPLVAAVVATALAIEITTIIRKRKGKASIK